jgi:2-methylisocitrate lyase-like PEP mutase family enzyme
MEWSEGPVTAKSAEPRKPETLIGSYLMVSEVAQKMFKERLASGEMLVFGGVWDALSAKILESTGFDGLWFGSMTTTSSLNAALDIGLRSAREQVELVQKVKGVSKLPIVVDGENGWGGSVQTAYWVREFERAGAEGIMFDDSLTLLGSPYIPGSEFQLETMDDAVAKLRAAVDAKSNPGFQIIARSNALLGGLGMEEQIRRLKAYQKAGADILWASSGKPESLRHYRSKLEGPLWATSNPAFAEQAKMTIDDFRTLGVQVLCFESAIFLATVKVGMEVAREIRSKGFVAGDRLMNLQEFLRFMGYTEVPAALEKYRVRLEPGST